MHCSLFPAASCLYFLPNLVRLPCRPKPSTNPTELSVSSSFPRRLRRHNPPLELEYEDEDNILPRIAEDDEENVIGDCLVFQEGAFEGGESFPLLRPDRTAGRRRYPPSRSREVVRPENLIPDKWREAAAELSLTKKEKQKISRELRFRSRKEIKMAPPVLPAMEEHPAYKKMKLAQLNPVVLDSPQVLPPEVAAPAASAVPPSEPEGRAAPRNPRPGLSGGFEDITEFFSSESYVPGVFHDEKKPSRSRKLFTKEEKFLLNKRVPNVAEATSNKWHPLHTIAASGEFYLMDTLLKHIVDINAVDKDGLRPIHKAILGKKQAIISYLLRESANPFVLDKDGATLMHYAVQTASIPAIKILLLYNVDINKPDDDGWTPLHLAVQTRRLDTIWLLLMKGADKTLKNQDGLTPLGLCLYSGCDMRTYEIIKLLKMIPRSS